MPLQSAPEILFLRASILEQAGFVHGFSLRTGGVSQGPFSTLNLGLSVQDEKEHISENRRRFAEAVGYSSRPLFCVTQVHKNDVVQIRSGDLEHNVQNLEADGLITDVKDYVLGVRVADCPPVLLADPQTRAVAAIHMGWRSTAANIAARAVSLMQNQFMIRPERLIAAIGPHIGPCCFEVGEDVASIIGGAASHSHPLGPYVIESADSKKPRVNLRKVILSQLYELGLPREHIETVPGCTACNPEKFFSFRRDASPVGHQLAVIMSV